MMEHVLQLLEVLKEISLLLLVSLFVDGFILLVPPGGCDGPDSFICQKRVHLGRRDNQDDQGDQGDQGDQDDQGDQGDQGGPPHMP